MTQLSLRMEGDGVVRDGLNRYRQVLDDTTMDELEEVMEKARKRTVPYNGGNSYDVPERGYIRTGILGRTTSVEQNGRTFTIKSNAVGHSGQPYSVYVIGDAQGMGQARVHVGYWTTMRNAVDFEIEKILPVLDRKLQQGVEAVGL